MNLYGILPYADYVEEPLKGLRLLNSLKKEIKELVEKSGYQGSIDYRNLTIERSQDLLRTIKNYSNEIPSVVASEHGIGL